jgi:hypothetical protein
MYTLRWAVPVAYAADPLEEVLLGIQAELRRQNELKSCSAW